jgi:hypothetical protein
LSGDGAADAEAHLAALRRLLDELRATDPSAALQALLEAMDRSLDEAAFGTEP